MRFFGTLLATLIYLTQASAQFLNARQDAPGVDWKRIETPHYEIVFPVEITRDAQRVANTLEHLYGPVAKTLSVQPGKLPVFLDNQTSQANGFVGLGPRRSEWYSTPPQSGLLGTNDWYSLLATHEMRHTAQFEKLNDGFTRFAYFFGGEAAWSFFSFWSVPGWVWEGDAVGTETALTSGGRGRMPEFDRDIRALLLSGKSYSYYKAYLGSFKDWYPSIYHLGGLLTTHIKRRYGPEKFSEIMRRSANWSLFPWAWSMMANSEIDKTAADVYDDSMDELTSMWKEQASRIVPVHGVKRNVGRRDCWTNYLYPQYLADGSIIAQKWGMDDVYSMVRIDTAGEEHTLCLGALYDNPMSARGGRVAWNEPVPDLRWGKRDATRLCVLDVATGVKRVLASGERLFSPALSPDAARIAAVEFTSARNCAIVLLDAADGRELRRFANPSNDFLQTPSWSDDGASIVVVAVSVNKGKAVKRIPLATGVEENLLPYCRENVSLPALHGPWLLFNSPASGIDNVYAMDTRSGIRYAITSSTFGAYNPCVSADGKSLLVNEYTVEGFDVEELPFDTAAWKPATANPDVSIRYYEPLVAQEGGGDVTAGIPEKTWEVGEYSAWTHLFNIHSWGILPGTTDNSISLGITSNNPLNTLGVNAGGEYDFNQQSGFFNAEVSYAGLFPIIAAGFGSGRRSSTYTDGDGVTQRYTWNERSGYAGVSLPLNFSRGVYSMRATLAATVSFTEVSDRSVWMWWEVNDGFFAPVTYEAHFAAGYQWMRDITPRWGQFLSLAWSHTPFTRSEYTGSLLSATGTLYFPGFMASHGIAAQFGYEQQEAVSYRFASRMLFPRGFESRFHETMYKAGGTYAFPIWYPDLHAWSLVNVQRLRANFFYDFGEGRDAGRATRYQSRGAELIADVNVLALPFLLNAGVRVSFVNEERKPVTEFVFGLGL